jgi:hypothetical protein
MQKSVKFYLVTVSELVSEGEKEKWTSYPYLVEAGSTFEAEQIVTNNYKGLTIEWKIKSNAESKIQEVILQPVK